MQSQLAEIVNDFSSGVGAMKWLFFLMCLIITLNYNGTLRASTTYKIVTGSKTGTYIEIGKDLAKYVAQDAGFNLEVRQSAGSQDNLRRLREEPGVKFAIVQHDIYHAYKGKARKGDPKAEWLINKLRVILPLYNEEVHIIVRANSNMTYFRDIEDKIINFGPPKSGTELTVSVLYHFMFGHHVPEEKAKHFTVKEALKELAKKEIDVVVYVAGQPTNLFKDENPKLYKFLQVNPNDRAFEKIRKLYPLSKLKQRSYPQILKKDLSTLTVKAFLITFNFRSEARAEFAAFARSLCRNFARIQEQGHEKWKEVSLPLPPLPGGWAYYDATENILASCGKREPLPDKIQCDPIDRILGLCP